MNADTIFSIANLVAVAGWLLLMIAPRKRWATLTAGTAIPIVLGADVPHVDRDQFEWVAWRILNASGRG